MIPCIVYTDEIPLIEEYWFGESIYRLSSSQVLEALFWIYVDWQKF